MLFITAGMSSIGAKYLVAAGYLSSYSKVVWNTSTIISEQTIAGQILHALFGYSDQPMFIQVVFYIGTLLLFITLMQLVNFKAKLK